MSPADNSVPRATICAIGSEPPILERSKQESDELLGACSRCRCFPAAFRMRFIVRPSCPHVEKAELYLFPDLDRGAQQNLAKDKSSYLPSALAERGPIVHEVPALFEQVAAPVGGLDRVADSVGQGLLHNVVRVRSRLGGPVSERAAEA